MLIDSHTGEDQSQPFKKQAFNYETRNNSLLQHEKEYTHYFSMFCNSKIGQPINFKAFKKSKPKYKVQFPFYFFKPDSEIEKFQTNGYLKVIKGGKVFELWIEHCQNRLIP